MVNKLISEIDQLSPQESNKEDQNNDAKNEVSVTEDSFINNKASELISVIEQSIINNIKKAKKFFAFLIIVCYLKKLIYQF